ncbi:cell division protein ZipA C-terminal FtsZ-binding domain-containing protein [Niveibacterium terrae]|uniref:cell division protein ZipA C-terminal FtsZ-binding domain-containing protein n=1 Tax=Niveibacterium terrae TaxID=3373598 RepID=UPI003A925DB9
MAGNELLYGLLGLGLGVLVLVFSYNQWLERKHRKLAEQAFRSEHRDVLLEGSAEPTELREEPVEPVADEEFEERIEPASAKIPPAAPIGRAADPALPMEAIAIDAVIRIEAPAGLVASAVVSAAGGPLAQLQRQVRWYGLSQETYKWVPVDENDSHAYTRIAVAMQLADRRGPANERELEIFIAAIQRVCDQFLAVSSFGERAESLELGRSADEFCAATDVQIAINVVAGELPFAGTKLRGLAEAAGLKLNNDGSFHAADENGQLLFVLASRDATLFSTETLRQGTSRGVTLTLDVPRVASGVFAFDRMSALAIHLAESFNGSVVDDNGHALSSASLNGIRTQIQQFQQQMNQQGIPAGSPLALRLFS